MKLFSFFLIVFAFHTLNILSQEIPTKTVNIYSYPNGATIIVNGNELGKTPMKLEIEMFSDYLIRAKKDGYYADSKKIGKGYSLDKIIFTLISKNDNPKVVFAQGGSFTRGNDLSAYADEKPANLINVSSFYITEREIANIQFCEFLTAIGCNRKGQYKGNQLINLSAPNCEIIYDAGKLRTELNDTAHPATNISWYGANEYCKWLGGRLPTEAEWEYAALGGILTNNYIYAGSDNAEEVAWFTDNSEGSIHNVGELKPNELGLFDMSGNAMEWVNDNYGKNYYGNSMVYVNPQGGSRLKYKVSRGGAWNRGSTLASVKKRYPLYPSYSNENLGFRCVFNLKQ